jgi:valyl-tRNA synthetase
MKYPHAPYRPVPPVKTKTVNHGSEVIYTGDLFALDQIPSSATHMKFDRGDDSYDGCQEVRFIEQVNLSEEEIAKDTAAYEKKLKKYEKDLAKFNSDLKSYNENAKNRKLEQQRKQYLRLKKKFENIDEIKS